MSMEVTLPSYITGYCSCLKWLINVDWFEKILNGFCSIVTRTIGPNRCLKMERNIFYVLPVFIFLQRYCQIVSQFGDGLCLYYAYFTG